MCPRHENVIHCPLYVAAHSPEGHGCDDGKMDGWEGCAVERGVMGYNRSLAALFKVRPATVRNCATAEGDAMARKQRAANMRSAGVH